MNSDSAPIHKAALFRCGLPGLGVLHGDGTVTLDPKAGRASVVRDLIVACGESIVPVLSLAHELQKLGITIRGDNDFGAVGAAAIAKGEVVDQTIEN